MTHADDLPYRVLLKKVFLQALMDLHSTDQALRQEALEFLGGPVARYYVELLDLPQSLPWMAILIHSLPEDFAGLNMAAEVREEAERVRREVQQVRFSLSRQTKHHPRRKHGLGEG